MSFSAAVFGRDSAVFKVVNFFGLGIPGWLDDKFSSDPGVQRLGDISQQTAKEGGSRTIVWGRVRAIGGNIIHVQTPQIRVVTEETEGGKGGDDKQEVEREHVYRTYAIGVCEGPITGYTRIWRNNKLVYDARGNAWGTENNPVFLETFTLFTGSFSQLPSAALEAVWGVGNVPAYRGTAYMVADDENLTDFGGGIPQWQFEVERAQGIFYTSRPYPIEVVEELEAESLLLHEGNGQLITEHLESIDLQITAGIHRSPLVETEGLDEIETVSLDITAGSFRAAIIDYNDGEPEELENVSLSVDAGELRMSLIQYDDYPAESLETNDLTILGGSHNAP